MHASVYCGDQQRSYHGTTLQVVQPDPQLIMEESESVDHSIPDAFLPSL